MNVLKRIGYWLDDHKTKLSGMLLSVAAYLQANEEMVQMLMTPKQFAWFTLGIGVLVVLIGSTNTARQKAKQQEKI